MRILVDCSTVHRGGGVAVYIVNLLNNFSEKNEITALVADSRDEMLFNAKKNIVFKTMRFYNIFTRLIYEQVLIPVYALYNKADVVYLPKQYASVFKFAKIVTTIHDFIPDKKSGGESFFVRIYWKIQYNLIKMKSDGIIFYNGRSAEEYKKRFKNLSRKRYTFIANGYDSYEKRKNQKNEYILIPSTLKKRKNIETALKLAGVIKKKYPDKKIVVIGRTDSENIKKRIEENEHKAEFLGFVEKEKAEELFNDAFVIIYLSENEGFGLPIAEAISLDKMVIASDIKVNRSIYKEMPIYYNLSESAEENAGKIIAKLEKGANYEEKKRTWNQAGRETEDFIESVVR